MKKYLPILATLLVGAALFVIFKPSPSGPGIAHAKPDVSIGAPALFAEFMEDESGANEKYLNKVVVVSGIVREVLPSGEGTMPVIKLETGSPDGAVICQLEAGATHGRLEFHVGESLHIKGVCMDFYRDVKLVGCVVQ